MKPSSRNPAFKNTQLRKIPTLKLVPLNEQYSSVTIKCDPVITRLFQVIPTRPEEEYPGLQVTKGKLYPHFYGSLPGWGEVTKPLEWPAENIEEYEVSIKNDNNLPENNNCIIQ